MFLREIVAVERNLLAMLRSSGTLAREINIVCVYRDASCCDVEVRVYLHLLVTCTTLSHRFWFDRRGPEKCPVTRNKCLSFFRTLVFELMPKVDGCFFLFERLVVQMAE